MTTDTDSPSPSPEAASGTSAVPNRQGRHIAVLGGGLAGLSAANWSKTSAWIGCAGTIQKINTPEK